ncbi:MAG: hypothetical protein EOP48_25135 [Sphingobacteriales bacterium]|nr:MAG: hypothetical protein EOP48_25135 [Sphingobacteriales bacterium]
MENKGPFLSALLFFLGILSAQAQIGKDSLSVEVSSYCSYDSGTGGDSTCKDVLRLRYEPYKRDDLLADVKKVLLTLGIAQNPQFGLINSQGVKALYCKQKSPLILINKNIADTYGKWELWGIAFHEVGHYANDHENLCSNPELELDADFFSGSCLAILGATKKETVECYLKITETELGSHPKRDLRIARALQGYDNILSSMKLKSFTSVNPVITWKKHYSHKRTPLHS